MPHQSKIFSSLILVFIVSGMVSSQSVLPLDFNQISKAAQELPEYGTSKAGYHFKMISLPMPSGPAVDFVVKHAPLARVTSPLYKGVSGDTYSLHAPEVAGYNGSMIVYQDGIHATLNTPDGLLFIERTNSLTKDNSHSYTYYKDVEPFIHNANDAIRPSSDRIIDSLSHQHQDGIIHSHDADRRLKANNNFFQVGGNNQRKVVDLFIISEQSFLTQFQGNVTAATARVVEIVNGVRVIWEQDFNITLNYMGVFFHPNTLDTDAAETIWNAVSDSDVVGGTKADVDLAHYFVGAGGGGAATLFIACDTIKYNGHSASDNVQAVSYVPLVAHEMAHQMGIDHTWTGNNGFCTDDQFGWSTGVEPGAGVTLAAYDGICGNDNLPNVVNGDFHHMESVREVVIYAQSGLGKSPFSSIITEPGEIPQYANNYDSPTCIEDIAYTNAVPQVNANPDGLTNLNIPARTPFELNGSATDADGDPLIYQWDQLDFALTQAPLDGYASREDGPLFRSYFPGPSSTRIFPKLNDILQDVQIPGEILPQISRIMRFGLMVRDGKGGVGMDTIGFRVLDSGESFNITESIDMSNPSSVMLSWNVANTNTPPISCDQVSILYSRDGGRTFPHTVLASTDNDGSESVNLAQFGITSSGRLKLKCATSIFFDINNQDLEIVPLNCDAQASQICDPQNIDAPIADASLNLNEADRQIGTSRFSNFNVRSSGTPGNSIVDVNGNCGVISFSEYPITIEFTVSQDAQYNIRADDNSTIAILEKENYIYNSNDPCNDSGIFLGANFNSIGNPLTLNPSLEKCKSYTLVVTAITPNDDIAMSIAGNGNVFIKNIISEGSSYTYIAVNESDGQIDAVSDVADFTSLGAGTYKAYGVSYTSDINTATWVGVQEYQALDASICAMKSFNFHTLNITGEPCTPTNTTTTVLPNDIVANVLYEDGNIISGGLGANKVIVNQNNITFRAQQKVEFIPEFEITIPNIFTAEIVPCSTN